MWLSFFLLVLGLVFVVKGADFLVEGSSSIAKKFKIPEIVIGLTIVAFGTSCPELIVNIFASVNKNNELVLGNVIGSNIFNILLILGLAGIIYPLTVQKNTVWREIPFSLISVILLFILANYKFLIGAQSGEVSRIDGVILLLFFVVFLLYIFKLTRITVADSIEIKTFSMPVSILFIILGFTGLFIGGQFVVDHAVKIAKFFQVSDKLIALTIISIGTSLPEVATSVVAALKKRSDISIGNIVGSCIFNTFFILGISAVINPVSFPAIFNIDLFILLLANILLFVSMFTGKKHKLDRWEAVLLLAGFAGYFVFIILRK